MTFANQPVTSKKESEKGMNRNWLSRRALARQMAFCCALFFTLAACQREEPPQAPAGSDAPGKAAAPASSAGKPAAVRTALPRPPRAEPTPPPTPVRPIVEPAPGRVRVGYVQGLGAIPVIVDQRAGWFRERKLDVVYAEPFPTSRACLAALRRGELEAATGVNLYEALALELQSPGALLFLGFSVERAEAPVCGFFSRGEAGALRLEDLPGQTLATTGSDYAAQLAMMILYHRLGENAVKVKFMALPNNIPDPRSASAASAIFATEAAWARLTRHTAQDASEQAVIEAGAAELGTPFPLTATVVSAAVHRAAPERWPEYIEAQLALFIRANEMFPESLPWIQQALGLDDETALNLNVPEFMPAMALDLPALESAASLWLGGGRPAVKLPPLKDLRVAPPPPAAPGQSPATRSD